MRSGEPVNYASTRPQTLRIEPTRGWVALRLNEVFAYRELLYFLVWRDLKVRYKQTILGVAWAVLQPLLMKEGLELPPVLTILGQALFSLVFGFLGLLVAVPVLATVLVPVRLLYVRDVVGDEVTVPGRDDDK